MTKSFDSCTVCHKNVLNKEYSCEYHMMRFYFCSKQCFDGFIQQPNHFLKTSNKQASIIKKNRVISLQKPLPPETIELVKAVIFKLIGVKKVLISQSEIIISYHLTPSNNAQIDEALSEISLAIKNDWFNKLHHRLRQKNESNAVANLNNTNGNRSKES